MSELGRQRCECSEGRSIRDGKITVETELRRLTRGIPCSGEMLPPVGLAATLPVSCQGELIRPRSNRELSIRVSGV